MGFFRKSKVSVAAPSAAQQQFQGRHFHSDLDEATCVAKFRSLVELPDSAYSTPVWTGAADKAPSTLLAVETPAGRWCLAIWPQGGYQEGSGYQEMAVVLPNFNPDAPFSLPGEWKVLDPSLKSIGLTTGFSVDDS